MAGEDERMTENMDLTDDEKIDIVAKRVLERFKPAFIELAKGESVSEIDVKIAEEAYEEYVADGKKSRPIEELWKELDL